MSSYPLTHLTPFHEFPIDSHGTANEALKWLIKDDSGDLKNSDCSREVSWYHSSDTKLFLVLHKQKKLEAHKYTHFLESLGKTGMLIWKLKLLYVCMYFVCMLFCMYVCIFSQLPFGVGSTFCVKVRIVNLTAQSWD